MASATLPKIGTFIDADVIVGGNNSSIAGIVIVFEKSTKCERIGNNEGILYLYFEGKSIVIIYMVPFVRYLLTSSLYVSYRSSSLTIFPL